MLVYNFVNYEDAGISSQYDSSSQKMSLVGYYDNPGHTRYTYFYVQKDGFSIIVDGTKPFAVDSAKRIYALLNNYLTDAAAGTAGLTTGMLYQTAGVVKVKQWQFNRAIFGSIS